MSRYGNRDVLVVSFPMQITHCKEAVDNLCFSLRYLLLFTNKACALSDDVTLRLSAEAPLMVKRDDVV